MRLFHLDNQFQFSIELILKILTTNPKRKLIDRLIELLSDPNELIDILHIIEDGLKIIDENTLTSLLNEQITSIELLEVSPKSIYSIVYEDDEYRLVDPNSRAITESHLFELDTDPFIEVTLMNLIKEIISNRLISNCTDIEHVIARFSSIYQRCLNLQVYQVNNIDKLCSLMSLLRCIQTLFPSKTIEIYRKISNDYQIRTCDDIHRFMTKLERNLLHESGSEYNQSDIRWILLKLEIQFLKDCWKQNKNELWNLLKLIDQKEKPLWKYSSTIFYSLISDFNLSENIESNDDFPLDQSDEINQLNQQGQASKVTVIQSVKNEDYAAFAAQLHSMLPPGQYVILTAENPISKKNLQGKVQADTEVYVSGSEMFIELAQAALVGANVNPSQVHIKSIEPTLGLLKNIKKN